jgi:hypothetical protein
MAEWVDENFLTSGLISKAPEGRRTPKTWRKFLTPYDSR